MKSRSGFSGTRPTVELLAYLRANGFKTLIVSGSGIEFMRPWTEKVYGIPPEQVVGSTAASPSRRSATRTATGRCWVDARRQRRAADDARASRRRGARVGLRRGFEGRHLQRCLDALMAEAKTNKWAVISMKNDWKRIFAFEP